MRGTGGGSEKGENQSLGVDNQKELKNDPGAKN